MDLELDGRHVFVAGASRGIGRAIAEGFLEAGAKVALTGRSEGPLDAARAELAERFGPENVFAAAGDMTRTDVLADALARAQAALGPLHAAIGNVGLDPAPFGWDVGDDSWESGIAQNFLSGVRLAREALRVILARPGDARAGANIVLVSSIAGVDAMGTVLTYGPNKAATNHYVAELAKIVGREGVRVNAVAPGNIIFPGGSWEARLNERPEAWTRWINREVALRRFGRPEEIADAVLFLASSRAGFVTGTTMVVDGGQVR